MRIVNMGNKNPSHQVSFGQGQHPLLSVNPETGKPGSNFELNATRFDAGVNVQIEILDSQNRVVYSNTRTTDSAGSIGTVRWLAFPNLPAGEYKFVAKGLCHENIQDSTKYFTMI